MKPSLTFLVGLTGPLLSTQGVYGFQFPDCVNGPLANNTVCNTKASPSERAAALVKALTTSEKLVNLVEYVSPKKRSTLSYIHAALVTQIGHTATAKALRDLVFRLTNGGMKPFTGWPRRRE